MAEPEAAESRLLSFEAAGGLFALPISEVLEVSEATAIASIPTLERSRGGVMNHRGDALPVVSLRLLLGGGVLLDDPATSAGELAEKHLLVLAREDDLSPQLGLPVDGVRGFVSAPADSEKCDGVVKERFRLEGREVLVIDSRQLMARAKSVIEGGGAAVHPTTGG